MRAEDQFHIGIVVDDFEATLGALAALFGYEWCDEIGGATPVKLPDGDSVLELWCAYSKTAPRLEIVRSVPGTLWEPVAGSGVHHVGYWSDDVPADSAELARRGFATEAAGTGPDGVPYWAFHRGATGPRIELVSRTVLPAFEQYWATGKLPS
jgi:hypothetical protein